MAVEDLDIRLLGPIELVVDGVPVELGGERQRLLLARLALSVDRSVPVGALVALLWPVQPPARAVENLQSHVSRLRRRVGATRLVKKPGGYRLSVPRGAVDANRVEDALARCAEMEPAERAAVLDEARLAWRGPSLGDVADSVALLPEVTRLDELRLRVIERWAEAMLAIGEGSTAMPVLEAEAVRAPARERLQLALIEALGQSGRPAAALRAAHELRTDLVERTGLEPAPRLAELERELLGVDGPSEGLATPETTWSRRAPANELFGRVDELRRLHELAAEPGLVSIVGPGGIGKTRLLLEHLDRLAPEATHYLVELGSLAPGADVVGPIACELGLGAVADPEEAIIADRLDSGAVLALDNCEHVLDQVAAFVGELLARRSDLTVVATSRTRLGLPGEHLLEVGPLDRTQQIGLFLDRAREARPDFELDAEVESLASEIVAASDGLPLAIELAAGRERVLGIRELAHRLRELCAPSGPLSQSSSSAPISLDTMVMWSLDLLTPSARELFDRLCLVPGEFGLPLAETVHDGDVVTDLASLVDAGLVEVDHQVEPVRHRILFLVRQAGAEALTPDERTDGRARLVAWIEAVVAEMRADQNLRQAGATASLHRETALVRAVFDWLVDSDRVVDAARLAVDISLLLTDEPSADWLLWLVAVSNMSDTGDAEANGLFALAAAAGEWIRGDHQRAREQLRLARLLLEAGHDFIWYVHFLEAAASMSRGDPSRVEPPALAVHDDERAPAFLRATALCWAALICQHSGGRRAARRWLEVDPALLDAVGEVDGFMSFTEAELVVASDPNRALELLDAAYALCDAAGHTHNRTVVAIARLAVLVRLGRNREAVHLALVLVDRCHRAGMWPQLWGVVRLVADLLIELGAATDAAVLMGAADADPRRRGSARRGRRSGTGARRPCRAADRRGGCGSRSR